MFSNIWTPNLRGSLCPGSLRSRAREKIIYSSSSYSQPNLKVLVSLSMLLSLFIPEPLEIIINSTKYDKPEDGKMCYNGRSALAMATLSTWRRINRTMSWTKFQLSFSRKFLLNVIKVASSRDVFLFVLCSRQSSSISGWHRFRGVCYCWISWLTWFSHNFSAPFCSFAISDFFYLKKGRVKAKQKYSQQKNQQTEATELVQYACGRERNPSFCVAFWY